MSILVLRAIAVAGLAAGFACFSAAPVLADARTTVMARADTCSILPLGQAWLDCFYGAAQPLRDALKLPPAPQAAPYAEVYQGTPLASPTDTRGQVLNRVRSCAVLPQGGAWLDCFYGAAQPARAALKLTPAPQAQQFAQVYDASAPAATPAIASAAPPHPAPPPVANDGLFSSFSGPKPDEAQFGLKGASSVSQIENRVAGINVGGGRATIILSNGEVWQQLDKQPLVWSPPAENYTALIAVSAGGYSLQLEQGRKPLGSAYPVKRLR